MGEHIEKPLFPEVHVPGCVHKHQTKFEQGDNCSYRYNGYVEMSTKSCSFLGVQKRTLYEVDFTDPKNSVRLPYLYFEYFKGNKDAGTKTKWADKAQTEPNWENWRCADNPLIDKTAWHFKKDNYKTDYLPFGINYHHIMPEDALKTELDNNELFLLQWAEYNLHHGDNMIILPKLEAYAYALLLPSHYTNHPDYNLEASKVIQNIKGKIKKKEESHAIGSKDDAKAFMKALINWQKRQFRTIVKKGKEEAEQIKPSNHFDEYGSSKDPAKKNTINKVPADTPYVRRRT